MGIKAKACWNCKEYIILHDGSFENQKMVNEFIRNHSGHTLMTTDVDEIKDKGYGIAKIVGK